VIPGRRDVSRVVIADSGTASSRYVGCWEEPAAVEAGQTVGVKIGGKGRPVSVKVGQATIASAGIPRHRNRRMRNVNSDQ
jgi:hypothetical protein